MTEPSTQNHRKATHQAERIAGWCIAHAPPGLAAARWTHPTPTTGRMQPSPPDSTGLACVLAYQRWAPVLEQLLARPDAPDAQQVQALRAICLPGLLKGAIASDQGPVLDKAHSAYEPLLHQALHDEDLATARVLLAHGVSPHHANDAGVPAWYYARSPRALELLIAHGLDPARAGECRLAPAAWWAHALGSSQAAAPMVSCYNQWLQQALPDEERARATLIQLAGSLENDASLATLRAQMQGLGRLVHGEWTEHGRTWTLATRALACAVCCHPSVSPAHAEALGRGALDAPIFQGLDNDLVAWWLARQWKDKRLEAKARQGFEPTVSDVEQWTQALLDWADQPPQWFPHAGTPQAREALVAHAASALRHIPDGADPDRVHALNRHVFEAVRRQGNEETRDAVASLCLDRAHAAFRANDLVRAAQWACLGLAQWATLPEETLLGTGWDMLKQLNNWLATGRPVVNAGRMSATLARVEILQQLADSGVRLDDPDLVPAPEAFASWANSPGLAKIKPFVDAVVISLRLPAPAPRQHAPRF